MVSHGIVKWDFLGASGGSSKEVNFFTEVANHSIEFCHDFHLQNMHVNKTHGLSVSIGGCVGY